MDLPRLIAFNSKNNFKYLRYQKEDGELNGYLQYSSDAIVTPYTKFEVERSKAQGSGYSGLVHIRCSYNNKYLVRKSSHNNFIVAASDEPEEDRSKWTCTLFEPIYDQHFEAYRFRHVQLTFFLCLWKTADKFLHCLAANNPDPVKDHSDLTTITDWQSLCILPKFVAFKQGTTYLKCYNYDDNYYLQFGSSEITDELAGHEVFTMNDGSVRIKSTHWDYWRRDPNWIRPDSKDTTSNDSDTLFWPVLVSEKDKVVALQNLGNHNYCKRLTADDKESCLNAGVDSITDEAKMEVYEYVNSREIYNVQFHMDEARVYDRNPQTMASHSSVNKTDEEDQMKLVVSYEKSSSSSWETTLGMKLGVKMELVAKIPLVAEAKFETNFEFSGSYAWGETHVKTEHVEAEIEVTVPPRSERRVSVVGTQAKCDIPFSYSQRDRLANGEVVITEKHDGIYTALNYYKFENVIDDPRSL